MPGKHSNRCRILFLVGQLGTGGLERQLYYLLRQMDRQLYKPAVLVWDYDPSEVYVERIRELSVPVLDLGRILSLPRRLLKARQLVNDLQPEIVHSYSFWTNFIAEFVVWGTPIIAVGSIRSDFFLDKQDAGFVRGELCARWPRHQVCNNQAALNHAAGSGWFFVPEHLTFVRNALDIHSFPNLELPVTECTEIVGIGSLIPTKRWDLLILAAVQLRESGLKFRIRIAGIGRLHQDLIELASSLGVSDYIEFLGHVPDVADLLSGATCLVLTSDAEGTPNVVMEAMASARPVVATDVGDVASLIEDGRNGFIVSRNDIAALTDRICLLARDRELSTALGRAGRRKAEVEFSLKRLLGETLEAYQTAGWTGLSLHMNKQTGKEEEMTGTQEVQIDTVGRSVGYANGTRYRTRAEFLFKDIPLAGATVLEIGCGAGAWALWAAMHGAEHVTGIEPEADGSTTSTLEQFRASIRRLGLEDRVVASDLFLQDLPDPVKPYDVIVMYNVINHLDEDSVETMHHDTSAFDRYVETLRSLRQVINRDGWAIVADCTRSNFWQSIGLKSPLAPNIDWDKHQHPEVWTRAFELAGFKLHDLRWSPLQPFIRATSSRLVQYFTQSHFVLRFRAV